MTTKVSRLRITIITIAIATLQLCGLALAKPAIHKDTKTHSSAERYLYVIHSSQASIEKKIKHGIDYYQIKIKKPIITYFTDRPRRGAGRVSVKNFIYLWGNAHNSFKTDNPNAYIVGEKIKNSGPSNWEENDVVTLSNPHHTKDTLTFTAKNLPHSYARIQTGKIKDDVIFIDDSIGDCTLGDIGPDCP